MPTTIIVNHGTSWANAKSIAQHGFSPSREEGSYLGAGVYAANEAKLTGHKPMPLATAARAVAR